MTRISSCKSNPGRRMNRKQGVIVSDKLPGRFPDSEEYKTCGRTSVRKKSAESTPEPQVNFCFGRILSF